MGDQTKLRQILLNLLSNAIKFTSNVSIEIKVRTKREEGDDVRLFISVIDSGIGIHFTAYENIKGNLIPELFLIKNFKDPKYNSLYPDGIRLYRNTLAAICKMKEEEKK